MINARTNEIWGLDKRIISGEGVANEQLRTEQDKLTSVLVLAETLKQAPT